jgi:hypothetical protein
VTETLTLRVEIVFDSTGPRDAIEALKDITSGVEAFILDSFTADNPDSEEMAMRYDGWQGPFVLSAEGEIH